MKTEVKWFIQPEIGMDRYNVFIVRYYLEPPNLPGYVPESAPLPKPKPWKVTKQEHICSEGYWKQHEEMEQLTPAFTLTGQMLHSLNEAQLVDAQGISDIVWEICMKLLKTLESAGKGQVDNV